MRNSLKNLFSNVVTLQYTLPSSNGISKSTVSTHEDFAFKVNNDNDVAKLIYNSIVDLAFDDYQIDVRKLNNLQRNALDYRLRFNVGSEDDKLKLGFYGEALLNVFLQVFFGTDVLVARGEFFDLLSNSEIHGYDCHHIIEKNNALEFWCGEVKFYEKYTDALVNIWKNLNNDITFEYLDKNLHAIIKHNISAKGVLIEKLIKECQENPYRNFYKDILNYGGKLVFPIMVISNELQNGYDNTIQSWISKIDTLNSSNPIVLPTDLTVELFFIFVPVENAKRIKLEVLKCIQTNKPLI